MGRTSMMPTLRKLRKDCDCRANLGYGNTV